MAVHTAVGVKVGRIGNPTYTLVQLVDQGGDPAVGGVGLAVHTAVGVNVGRIANPTYTLVQLVDQAVDLAVGGVDPALAVGARRAVPLLRPLLHYGDFFVGEIV